MAPHAPEENDTDGPADIEARAKLLRGVVFGAVCVAVLVTLWALTDGADRNLFRSPTATMLFNETALLIESVL